MLVDFGRTSDFQMWGRDFGRMWRAVESLYTVSSTCITRTMVADSHEVGPCSPGYTLPSDLPSSVDRLTQQACGTFRPLAFHVKNTFGMSGILLLHRSPRISREPIIITEVEPVTGDFPQERKWIVWLQRKWKPLEIRILEPE